jgi:hypothetical protein
MGFPLQWMKAVIEIVEIVKVPREVVGVPIKAVGVLYVQAVRVWRRHEMALEEVVVYVLETAKAIERPQECLYSHKNRIRKKAVFMKWLLCICIALQRNKTKKFETNIPRKGIAWPQQPHTFMCLWAIYIFPQLICMPILLQENMWTDLDNI